ncbi:MAG TPA: hypothetical protein VH986_07595 [Acidimicrobiia bacterium]
MLATDFTPAAVALLVLAGACAIAFGVYFVLRFAASFPDLPPPGPETSDLGAEPPAVANLLANRCKVTSAAAAATLLDLAARHYLELQQLDSQHFVVRLSTPPHDAPPLAPYEEQVMDLVRGKATGGSAPLEAIQLDEASTDQWRDRFGKLVITDARARGLLRGRWSRADWIVFGVLLAAVLAALAGGLFLARVEDKGGKNGEGFDRETWFLVALVAWAALMAALRRLRSIRYSAAGTAAAARWLGLKRYLQRDPQFGDTPPAGVTVWNRLLSYGAALGVAHAAVAAIPLEEEDPDVAWSRVGGTWHQVHVEYPTHFGYGEKPLSVFGTGLLRTAFFGVIAFVVLPIVVDAVWNVGSDALDDLDNAAALGIVLFFVIAFGAIGVVLVVRLADGVIRLVRGALDLRATSKLSGDVVKRHHDESRSWFAVDPGGVDEVKALHPDEHGVIPSRGARVEIELTPHLRHVIAIRQLPDGPG